MEGEALPPPLMPAKNRAAKKIRISAPHFMEPSGMSFVDLPAEVRNEIYEYLFHEGNPVQLLARNGNGYISMSDRLGLLATCYQLYREVSSFLRCQGRLNIVQPKTVFDLTDIDRVQVQIFKHLLARGSVQVTCDLDLGTTKINALPPLFHANREFRELSSRYMYTETRTKVTASDNFRTLRQSSLSPFIGGGYRRHGKRSTELILCFPLGNDIEEPTSCFQASHLIWATEKLQPRHVSEVSLRTCSIGESTQKIHDSMPLPFFRARLLLFVHELLETSPDGNIDPCPAIWVDLDLKIVRADFGFAYDTIDFVESSQCNLPWLEIDRSMNVVGLISLYRDREGPRLNYDYGCTTDSTVEVSDTHETLLGFAIRLAEMLSVYY